MTSSRYLPGTFRKRVTIQGVTQTPDGQGGFTDEWGNLQDVYASVEPLKAYERFQAMQMQTPITHKIVMRYHPLLTTASRLQLGNLVFWVKEIINIEERNRFLVIKAIERAGAATSALRSGGLLMEDGSQILTEDGAVIGLEQPSSAHAVLDAVGLEDGTALLGENGTTITIES